MTFRISSGLEGKRFVVRFAGDLDAEAVEALEKELLAAPEGAELCELILTESHFADSAGAAFLRSVQRNGVSLEGVSGFLREAMATRGD